MEDLGVRLSAPDSVAVIGGGWAGLAAAVTLAGSGRHVTLYESAAQLGGRARRVALRDLALDNGQHILIGAYRETLRLLDQVGVDHARAFMPGELDLRVLPDFHLRALPLPAPLHLAAGFLAARGLKTRDKLAALRLLAGIKRERFRVSPDQTLTEFLKRHAQTPALCRYLWHPLCLAALNTPPTHASAQVFVNVLRDAFFNGRADSRLLLPRVDIGQLLPEPATRFLAAQGSEVQLGCRIKNVTHDGTRFTLHHDRGEAQHAQVICAVSPARFADLTNGLPELEPLRDQTSRYRYQPIYTVYLQYAPGTRLPGAMLGMSEGTAQWIFDRGQLDGYDGLLAVVISGEGTHQALAHDVLASQVAAELARHFELPGAPLWSQVIAEKRATFSCEPAIPRPPCRTPLARFYVAGDYTESDYPATLEAAVRSGVQCARLILESPT